MQKRVLITGCGRSGTLYASVLLKKCGLDVPHEVRMGRDGISSWLFGTQSASVPWGPSPRGYSFEHVIQLVRDPLACIPSIAMLRPAAWEYIADHVSFESSDSQLLKSAKYWYRWNVMVERRASLRLKIEDMPGALAPICDRLDVHVDIAAVRHVPKDLNTRRYGMLLNSLEFRLLDLGLICRNPFRKKLLSRLTPRYGNVTWDDLRALDGSLMELIRGKALEYGYECG
jgi:hypothetical protein